MTAINKMPTAVEGYQVVGKVVILYGTVKAISPDGAVRLLAPNSPIFANDRIVTESDGNVSIMMSGEPPTQMDLGRMSNVLIDDDVYSAGATGVSTDVAAEAEQIQKVLAAGDEPIELQPAAAGGEASAGGGHPVFTVIQTANEVSPQSGAETIGVTYGTVNTVDTVFEQPAAIVPTNISLTATPIVNEGGEITYTATITTPAQGAVDVVLSNGAHIIIADGATSGTVTVPAPGDDVYIDAGTVSANIVGSTGGSFANLVINETPAVTNIPDTINPTTVNLAVSPAEITEAGAVVTYTATLTNPAQGAVTVTLSNGQVINIADGQTSGAVDHTFAPSDDVYIDPASSSVTISSASGGNFESLVVDATPAVVAIADTINATSVNLAVSPVEITEAGAVVTYTATLTNPAQGAVTVTLSNGQVITIADGQTSGAVEHTFAPSDDVYIDPSSSSVTISSASGGNFESLVVDATPAVVAIADTINATSVNLAVSPAEITEAGAAVTYTATLTNPAQGDVTVTLSNGQVITIADGQTTGTVDHTFAPSDDVYIDPSSSSVTINSASGGNFENLVVDTTPAVVAIADTINPTTVNLAVSPAEITEAGAVVTYTATLTNPAQGAVTVTLSNGQVITIADGQTTGTVDHTFAPSDDVYIDPSSSSVTINSASGGNFENLVVDTTPAVVAIADTINPITVGISASDALENAGSIFTVSVSQALTDDLTVHLSNGADVVIKAGDTSANYTLPAQGDDVYIDPGQVALSVNGAEVAGKTFESLVIEPASGTSNITDTINPVTATLTATGALDDITGGSITYTVQLSGSPGDVAPKSDLIFNLASGDQITIKAGETSGTLIKTYTGADITDQANITNAFDSTTPIASGGGEYESLSTAGTTLVDINYPPVITDLTPEAQGGDVVVNENDLLASRGVGEYAGSDSVKESTQVSGTFTIKALDGVQDVTIDGHNVIVDGAFNATSFTTALGNTFEVTGYDSATGVISYSYTLLDNEMHQTAGGTNSLYENLSVVLTDTDNDVANSMLIVNIVDDIPTLTNVQSAVLANQDGSITGHMDLLWGADGPADVSAVRIVGDDAGGNLNLVYSDSHDSVTAYVRNADGSNGAEFYTMTVHADGTYDFSYTDRPVIETPVNFGEIKGGAGVESVTVSNVAGYSLLLDGLLNVNGTLTDYNSSDIDDIKPQGSGFGVGSANNQTVMNNNEGFSISLTGGDPTADIGIGFDVVQQGSGSSFNIHWLAYSDSTKAGGALGSDTVHFDLTQSNVPQAFEINPGDLTGHAGYFEVWFTDVTGSNVRIEGFTLNESIIPEDQPLSFSVLATDADGDVTNSVGFNVLLAGGAGPGYTLAGGPDSEVIAGGAGNDSLSGGLGSDTFVASAGNDNISDYTKVLDPGGERDTVDIGNLLQGAATRANLSVTEDGGHAKVTISEGGVAKGSITFDNINFSEIAGGNETETLNNLLGKVDITDDGVKLT